MFEEKTIVYFEKPTIYFMLKIVIIKIDDISDFIKFNYTRNNYF